MAERERSKPHTDSIGIEQRQRKGRQIKHFNYTQACRWHRVQAAVVFQGQQRGKVKARRAHGFGTNTKRHKYQCLNTCTGTHTDQYLCGFIYTPINTHILSKQSLLSSAHRSVLPMHMFTELNNMHVRSCLQITYIYRFVMPEMIFHARMRCTHLSQPICLIFINLSPAMMGNEYTKMTSLKEKFTSGV